MYLIREQIMATSAIPQRLLNEQEAAAYMGLKPNTLAVWRSTGRYGLPFLKVGKAVRYRVADLEKWLSARRGGGPRHD
ncbi:MAG: helix-turn-helix domain-containing protein [Planctomycetes bacterium]|nr:helix-turn-helix domain-containing protein [Planctomycetota bacterium]